MRTIPTWDQYFFDLVEVIKTRSKDPDTQVGCVIVGPDKEIRATGYNGLPRHVNDDIPERFERPEKYNWFEHAERNAIYAAARVGVPLAGCTAYISIAPCVECARALIQAGIKDVVFNAAATEERFQRLNKKGLEQNDITNSLSKVIELFGEAEVIFRAV